MSGRAALHFALVLAVLVVAVCGREIDSRPAEPVRTAERSVGAAPEGAMDELVESSPSAPGRYRTHLYTERDADVHALIDPADASESTFVRAIYVDVGRRVGRGQALALLEDARQALAVEAARARTDEARAQAQRAKQLLEQELVPRAEYETLSNAQRVAEAELKQAQLELARTRVRAPFAGVIARRYVRVGQRIEPETPLFRVTAMAPLRARVLVPEREAAAFRPGATVRVTGVDGVSAEARIVAVSPTVDPGSGTREVVAELRAPSGFLPGTEVIVEPIAPEAER